MRSGKPVLKSIPSPIRKVIEAGSERLNLERAGVGLEKIVAGSLRHVSQDQAPLLAWPFACGSAVAERTRATHFSDAVLRIEVPDAGWKRELQNLAPRYLAALNRYTGNTVERVEFVIRPQ
jgi:Dna[CI] antecedent, DciA